MPNNNEVESELKRFMNGLARRNPGQPEFQQAVREVAETILPFTLENPIYREGADPGAAYRTRQNHHLSCHLEGR